MALIAVRIGGNGGGGFGGGSRGGYSYSGMSGGLGSGTPPFIVKLSSLPLLADEPFVEDLFRSRYTPVVKIKVVFDPLLSPLTTHVLRKVAFVEVKDIAEYQKVLRWFDCYYRPGKRVIIDAANFDNFQQTMMFNSEHGRELEALAQEGPKPDRWDRGGSLPAREVQGAPAPAPVPAKVSSKPRLNPFGNAKPVDIATKEKEIEKKVININGTTSLTVGEDDDPEHALKSYRSRRRHLPESISILKRNENQDKPVQKLTLNPSPEIPVSLQPNQSLAELLAKTPEKNTEKAKAEIRKSKPTILKKKVTTPELEEPTTEIQCLNEKKEGPAKDQPKVENDKQGAKSHRRERRDRRGGHKQKLRKDDDKKLGGKNKKPDVKKEVKKETNNDDGRPTEKPSKGNGGKNFKEGNQSPLEGPKEGSKSHKEGSPKEGAKTPNGNGNGNHHNYNSHHRSRRRRSEPSEKEGIKSDKPIDGKTERPHQRRGRARTNARRGRGGTQSSLNTQQGDGTQSALSEQPNLA